MAVYFLIFLIPVLATLVPLRAIGLLSHIQWVLFGIVLIIIIGLRHDVGGDWYNYIANYTFYEGLEFSEAKLLILVKDPAYDFIYWLSLKYLDGDAIYVVNLVCAIFFTLGLLKLCTTLSPMPWLAITISIPYVFLVVSLGYTRQAAALGFLMYGLTYLVNNKNKQFYMLIILGSFFHATLLITILLGFIYSYRPSIRGNTALVVLFALLLAALFLISKKIGFLYYHYVSNTELQSHGATLRAFINAIPALLTILYYGSFKSRFNDARLWLILSIFSIILLPISFYLSTVVDRIVIYVAPLQLIALSRFPVLIESIHTRTLFVTLIIFMYLLLMVVWLNFGIHANGWIPYDNFLLQ